MGATLKSLSKKDIPSKSIFNNRMVVEICEKVHVHYRNLRIILSLQDFLEMGRGMVSAFERWGALGMPKPIKGVHTELCRKRVATEAHNDGIQVNLNHNLYNDNKDKIYAEGADFEDKTYIHLKVRDLRLELSVNEFKELADVIGEAKRKLEDSDINSRV